MKIIYILIISFTILNTIDCQEIKVTPTTDWVEFINVNSVSIQGYDGTDIIINSSGGEKEDEEVNTIATGLKLWDQDEFISDAKAGLKIDQKNKVLVIKQISKNICDNDREYNIKVPKNMNIKYEHSSWDADVLSIEDMAGTIEVSSNYNEVILNNVTGPMAIKTVYGSIDAEFLTVSQEGSISLYSVYEHVNVTLPTSTKSKFNLSTSYGDIYTDFDINVDVEKSKKKGWTGSKLVGDLNGGGVDIIVTATYDNVYLRSK
ncbi:DUF4097 domain-containing protein [Saprospiraceae bacterium]|nr:DUF4097 domain-containing protein [Saprospiraceae bacterium]